MPRATVSVLKFVGTVGLGLLTGISYTHTNLSSPLLLTLPSATTASRTHSTLTHLTTTHSNALLVLSLSSYTLAYALSPPKGGRHPYLLWTSLLASLSWAVGRGMEGYWVRKDRAQALANGGGNGNGARMEEEDYVDATHSSANIMTPTSGQSENGEAGAGGFGLNDDASASAGSPGKPAVNGEQIRIAIERFGFVEGVKACMTGSAFLMAVVGIWGDGVGVRS